MISRTEAAFSLQKQSSKQERKLEILKIPKEVVRQTGLFPPLDLVVLTKTSWRKF